MDVQDLINLGKKGTTPSIKQICGLIKPFKSKFEALSSLYDGLDVLEQEVKTIQENKDGFLSRGTKDQQQLLEECHHLLKVSEIVCSGLYDEFKGLMQHSAIWDGVLQGQIQDRINQNTLGPVQLRIWSMRLGLMVKFMQLTTSYKRIVERTIKEVQAGLRSIDPEFARLQSQEFSKVIEICEIATEAVKEKQEPAIAENVAAENDSDITPALQTAAKSPWIRQPKA
ncbi:uncharacterized protein TrAtP1_002517 [Trichoderma atroviride]|uniref:uncharacterized protein n=1 Tax=Hypocrea atroviridis TaxID=63577 RepID=UPI003330E508|nr:hypothetical protein TrAtP1_002517 [Trichoderma atroviride]